MNGLDIGWFGRRAYMHGRQARWLLSLLALVLAWPTLGTQMAVDATIGAATPRSVPEENASGSCAVSLPAANAPPDDQIAPLASNWYSSTDGQLWLGQPGRWHAPGTKVPWWKPRGSSLEITGRRLDGEAPALEARVPDGYPDTFQASSIGFPVAGCWEINAKAGASSLRVVVEVLPRMYRPTIGSCADLADTLANSDTVVVGVVEGNTTDRPGFVWQTTTVARTLRGPVSDGQVVDVLQDAERELPLQRGEFYLLFLQAQLGQPWRIHCDRRTLARIDGEELVAVDPDQQGDALWMGTTLPALETQIQGGVATPAPDG